MASIITRISLAQESPNLEPSVFATTQTTETDCLLGGKTDSRQGQHQRACPELLGTPWIVLNGVPGKSGSDGASDERALIPRGKHPLYRKLAERNASERKTQSYIHLYQHN